jgi:hypothetical protein
MHRCAYAVQSHAEIHLAAAKALMEARYLEEDFQFGMPDWPRKGGGGLTNSFLEFLGTH